MKNIALFENREKPESIVFAEQTAAKLSALGSDCYAKPELIEKFKPEIKKLVKALPLNEFGKFADIVICFGGDGTILNAARSLMNSEIPIMGVNVGKLGFLAEFSIEKLDSALENLVEGNYRVVDRSVIETSVQNEKLMALNDFVIEKKDSSRMITIKTFTNEHHVADYRADGLIITTPTGSTAYSLSCGGPVIAPSTQVICLTPISPHSLNIRPLVLPDSNEVLLKIYSPTGEANLVVDGQITKTLNNNESIIFRKSNAIVKLIKPLDSSYYDLLRKKLLWATNAASMNDKISPV